MNEFWPGRRVRVDPKYLRLTEVDELCGDASKAETRFGWRSTVRFAELVRIMLEHDLFEAGLDMRFVASPFRNDGLTVRTSLRDRVLERAARATPGPLAAAIDQLRPALAQGFGGPFNGQERRVEAVRDMFAQVHFESIVETGTYRATTTLYLRRLADAPIATVEANSRYYHYAQRRLRGASNVTVIRGDSAEVLGSLATESPWNRNPAFFYLDAHWLNNLPLPSELEAINTGWRDYAVLIDDFRVPGDPGYAYDDYGPGRVLESAILAPLAGKPVAVYWPAAHSRAETGALRGWVVLATAGSVDDSFRSIGTLRRAGSVASVAGATGGTEVP